MRRFVKAGVMGACLLLFVAQSPTRITVSLTPLATIETGIFDQGASEISAYDPASKTLFITNPAQLGLDVVDLTDPSSPVPLDQLDLSDFGSPTHVAVSNGVVAVAVAAPVVQDPGFVVFFNAAGALLRSVQVGALPDFLIFTPDGEYLLVANEGEPSGYCEQGLEADPPGSVSIIDMRVPVEQLTQQQVATAGFEDFNGGVPEGVRIFGPNATVAQDLEPEFIAVSANSRQAWVVLQENNAIATLNIPMAKITHIRALGFKDHSQEGQGLDPSNRDDAIAIAPWPVWGMYQPDAIASYKTLFFPGAPHRSWFGVPFLVTANEGDARDYDCFSEEVRVGDLDLDPAVFPDAETLQQDENLGRLNTTTTMGNLDADPEDEAIFSYGARSFSIWTTYGRQIYDSGDDFEQLTAALLPDDFNSNNDENDSFDSRSDDKGPEPEGMALALLGGQWFAFVGLERIGGVMVSDITNPYDVEFVEYVNNRDFSGDAEAGSAGDLGPEGILFIPKHQSPNGKNLLVVANEVSGSTTIYNINLHRQ